MNQPGPQSSAIPQASSNSPRPVCAIYVTKAVIKSEPGSGGTFDDWSSLRLLLGEEGSLTLEKSDKGQWEGRGHVKFSGQSGRLSLASVNGCNRVEEVGYINVGAGIQAQYVGPEKHQYRFDSKVTRITHGPILELACDLSMSLPVGTQYPVENRRQAAAAQNSSLLQSFYVMMGNEASDRYLQTHNLADVDKAISAYVQALKLTPAGHSSLDSRLGSLGSALLTRFEHTGKLEDLKQAIPILQAAIEVTSSTNPADGSSTLADSYNILGAAFVYLCRATGQVEPADRAVEALEKAVQLRVDLQHPRLPLHYDSLGTALSVRFETARKVEDLEKSVEAFNGGIKATPKDDHSALARLYLNLGNPLSLLYEQTGDLAFLDKSLEARKTGIEIAPPGHRALGPGNANLGHGYYTRFKRTAQPQDIEDAISALKKAILLTPDGHSELPQFLGFLANALNARFTHFKDINDINESVTLQQKAMELCPPDLSTHLSVGNQDLGTSLLSRFAYTGDIRDVEQAIIALQKAADTCPSGHMHLPSIYNNLGIALSTRFRRTSELQFADRAIDAHRKAISLAPLNTTYQRLPSFYNDLGRALIMRFERTVEREDLIQAISPFRKAIELTPASHARLPGWYSDLADALATRSHHGGGMVDLEEALRTHEKAVELTLKKGVNMFSQHIQGGDLLMDRFRLSKDERDLTNALVSYKKEKALDIIPQGFAYLSVLHTSYASAMIERYQLTEHQPHFDTALEHYQLAAQTTGASPLSRFNAGRAWARFAALADRPDAMDAYQICIDLLPMAAGLDQTLDRRHDTLVRISDLSREASAFALRRDDPKTAVEWLEASRCLVGQLNNFRTPPRRLTRVR
ncbi:hypothetical protein H1R20_g1647, partial [Candolleomyces eurysporus]